MPQKTQNLGLEVFDFDTDSSPAFINGVAGLTDSNMHKIDKAITEMIKVNNEGVSLNLITSPSGEELERINDYTFSTDTISLRTPSSANAEERYRELLKATSQEFQSDGNDIVVENGIEYQVLVGAKLEGQTVKNIINYNKFTHNAIYNLGDSIFEITPNELYGVNFGMSLDCIYNITIGNTYTVVLDVIENTLDQKMSNAGLGHFPIYLDSIGQTGVIKRKYTPSNANAPYSFYFFSPSARSGKIRFKIQVLEGDWTNKEVGYFEGMSSTKATISNNGNKYSFYHPIIEGHTYQMKAPKGTQEWVVDDISQERDFEKYDYKLESPNGLHRVYDFKDKVDLQKREITTCTHFVNLDDIIDNDYLNVNLYPKENTSVFTIKTDIPMDTTLYKNSIHYITSNAFNMDLPHHVLLSYDKEFCSIGHSNNKVLLYLRVNIENTGKTKEGFKNYYRGKGIHFIIGSHIPITRKMTDEEYEYYSKLKESLEINSLDKYKDILEIQNDKAIFTKNVMVYDNFQLGRQSSMDTENTYCYSIAFYPYDFLNNGKIICNKLKTVPLNQNNPPDEEYIMYNGYMIAISIPKSKLKDSSVITARDYILQSGFKFMIPYKDEVRDDLIIEEIPTIATYETNKFSFGEEIKPSKASVDVSVDKISDLEKRVNQLKGVMTSISNLSLLGNYVEDEYNKEINQL